MMKNKAHNAHPTEEDFRKHLKRRALLMALYILFGAAILIWMATGSGGSVIADDGVRDFFGSFAGAILAIGAVKLAQIIRNMKSPERFQKAYTEYANERNRFVLMKTYYYSAYIFILLMALAVFVISALGMPPVIRNTLSVCIGVFALILNVTYRVTNKVY